MEPMLISIACETLSDKKQSNHILSLKLPQTVRTLSQSKIVLVLEKKLSIKTNFKNWIWVSNSIDRKEIKTQNLSALSKDDLIKSI